MDVCGRSGMILRLHYEPGKREKRERNAICEGLQLRQIIVRDDRVKTYTAPEGLDSEQVLAWLGDASLEFPCFLEIDGLLTVVNDEQELEVYINSAATGPMK